MTRYAFLGPAGTFSEEALFTLGIPDLEPVPCTSIEEVFEAVERGRADGGVVPIENSVEGSVPATLDTLAFDSQLEIQGELVLDIHHCLIAAPRCSRADLTRIVAHPQASGQCRRWIARNLPNLAVTAANSNAEAVRIAVEEPGVAAIGPALAADIYTGEILERDIEDYAGNQTRFVTIGRGLDPRVPGVDGSERPYKTSLALFLQADKPGALLMILSEFAYGEINLTKLQSRPTKRQLGDYMFFIDLEGHAEDRNVRMALDCLRLKLREVKVLGSYPRA